MSHPVVRSPHELTKPSPEFNIQLRYNVPPSLINPQELTGPPPEFNTQLYYNVPPNGDKPPRGHRPTSEVQYSTTLQCSTLL